jgi:predicted TIM-barrel enzyme
MLHRSGTGGSAVETKDMAERGLVDAIIVSGELTGSETNPDDVDIVRQNTDLQIIIGSGATPENLSKVFSKVDGLIVGRYFKKAGKGGNLVEEERVRTFTDTMASLKRGG